MSTTYYTELHATVIKKEGLYKNLIKNEFVYLLVYKKCNNIFTKKKIKEF